jgi:HPt (histidine-containing phosphotransfer) domain-containing protein
VEAREFINDIIGSEAARFADIKALKMLDAQLEQDLREPEFRSRD